jgi:hypothetical protein
VRTHPFFILAVLCVITACAADRYRWNLAHAEGVARPPITRSDLEAIVRLVTDATMAPIGTISREPTSPGQPEKVYVDAAFTTGSVDEFILEKGGSGWHIISRAESTDR